MIQQASQGSWSDVFPYNRLGGEVIANEINAPGFDKAGYQNLTTSDGIVHGQVKQSGAFSFVRIYER